MDDVRAQIAAGEGEASEFKSSLADSRRIIETIAALATRGGGTVLIGVKDDKTIVGANVGKGEVGRATVAMNRAEYERGLMDRQRESSGYERHHLVGVTPAQLDERAAREWASLASARVKELRATATPAEIAERLHLATGQHVTVAGWLLFGADPLGPLPQATIRALAARGTSKDALAIEGPLCRQIDDAVRFVARNLRVSTRLQGPRRVDVPELPLPAVREIVANAVAHRDYRSTAATQLRLTDDALELWNPGHLPPPLTPALLRERHPSVPPNPLLARALFLAGYIEEWGTGTLRVIEAMRANGNAEPLFEAEGDSGIRVTMPLLGVSSPGLTSRQEKTLRALRAQPFRAADYARRARVSLRTAGLDLKALEGLGVVKRVGRGRSTRWLKAQTAPLFPT